MKQYIKDEYWFAASVAGFGILSGSFLLMPLQWSHAWSGLLFWIGLILGTAAQIMLHRCYKHHLHSGRERKRGQRKTAAEAMKPQQPGMIRFFSNKEAKIADIILAAGLLGTAISIAVTNGVGYSCYVFIGISVFSFCMHCILNGRMYLYVKAIMTQKYNSK